MQLTTFKTSALAVLLVLLLGCNDRLDIERSRTVEGFVQLTSQSEVNEFAAQGYERINGTVHIGNPEGRSDIRSLSALNTIKAIDSTLLIYENSSLFDLDGLENLVRVGDLGLFSNENLSDLSALSNLTDVGTLRIEYSQDLTSLEVFADLDTIGGDFVLIQNDLLSTLDFSSLEHVAGDVIVSGNASMTELTWLPMLRTVGGSFGVTNHVQLPSLQGLNIQSIGESLTLIDNPLLTDLKGLESIESAGGLNIIANRQVTAIDELTILREIRGDVEISFNDRVSRIEFPSLTRIDGEFSVHGMPELTDLSGFSQLQAINGYLRGLFDVPQITDLQDLTSLTTLGGIYLIDASLESLKGLEQIQETELVFLYVNEHLSSMEGLDNLASVGYYFFVGANPGLQSLQGMENLSEVLDSAIIAGNDQLTDFCALERFVNSGTPNGLSIRSNEYNPTLQDLLDGNCQE